MRESRVRDQLQRTAHEIMSEVNIGSNTNKGPKLYVGTPVRSLEGVLTNNPGYTALSDEEIEEFSFKYNANSIVEGRDNPDFYCRLQFVGDFSLNTICYSIMKPCRCTVEFHEEFQIITTSWFSSMHSVTKLISRMRDDGFKDGSIYMKLPEGESQKVKVVTDINEMVDCLKICEKKNNGEELSSVTIINDSPREDNTIEELKADNCRLAKENLLLQEKIDRLEAEIVAQNEIIERIKNIVYKKEEN